MPEGSLKLLNWNIAGAKYLELRSRTSPANAPVEKTREHFREKLNDVLKDLIRRHVPDVITLQEVVRYHPDGNEAEAEHIVDIPDGYDAYFLWLIDRRHHSATGKWNKVRDLGEWSQQAFFAQGNA